MEKVAYASPRCLYGLFRHTMPLTVLMRLDKVRRISAPGDAAVVLLENIYVYWTKESSCTREKHCQTLG